MVTWGDILQTYSYLTLPPENTIDMLTLESSWNEELFRNSFVAENLYATSCLVIVRLARDRLIWHYDMKDMFSVNSGYKLTAFAPKKN